SKSTEASILPFPLDLHVLGLPPAFNLSHDQTLQLKFWCLLFLRKDKRLDKYCFVRLLRDKRIDCAEQRKRCFVLVTQFIE
ncbi:hypothetical protein, partial [Salinivibrio sp. AR640]|uniref:hypothetical protein n=1 Tax=Salinivibrio sp. AR640 TaxID=1909437 RepID=UPI001A7E3059